MLLKYSIKNFKCINNKLQLNFQNSINQEVNTENYDIVNLVNIHGANASGKTSIIQSIHELTQSICAKIMPMIYPPNVLWKERIIKQKNKQMLDQPIEWKFEFLIGSEILKYEIHFNESIIFEQFDVEHLNSSNGPIVVFKYDEAISNKYYVFNNQKVEFNNEFHYTPLLKTLANSSQENDAVHKLMSQFEKIVYIANDIPEIQLFAGDFRFILNEYQANFVKNNVDKILTIFHKLNLNINNIEVQKYEEDNYHYTLLFTKKMANNEDVVLTIDEQSYGIKKMLSIILLYLMHNDSDVVYLIDDLDSFIDHNTLMALFERLSLKNSKKTQIIFTSIRKHALCKNMLIDKK